MEGVHVKAEENESRSERLSGTNEIITKVLYGGTNSGKFGVK